MNTPTHKFAIMDEEEMVKVVTLDEWLDWMGQHKKRRMIERDEIEGYRVSTIFLGLDHQWHPDGRPLYFETMIFKPSKPHEPGDVAFEERYSTAVQARAGHARAVQWLKAKLAHESDPD